MSLTSLPIPGSGSYALVLEQSIPHTPEGHLQKPAMQSPMPLQLQSQGCAIHVRGEVVGKQWSSQLNAPRPVLTHAARHPLPTTHLLRQVRAPRPEHSHPFTPIHTKTHLLRQVRAPRSPKCVGGSRFKASHPLPLNPVRHEQLPGA